MLKSLCGKYKLDAFQSKVVEQMAGWEFWHCDHSHPHFILDNYRFSCTIFVQIVKKLRNKHIEVIAVWIYMLEQKAMKLHTCERQIKRL